MGVEGGGGGKGGRVEYNITQQWSSTWLTLHFLDTLAKMDYVLSLNLHSKFSERKTVAVFLTLQSCGQEYTDCRHFLGQGLGCVLCWWSTYPGRTREVFCERSYA